MHCSDLDRYLEAYLDGRLGRTRAAVLRRHLAVCAGCRRRVLALEAFNREIAERVSAQCGETVWSSLLTPDVQQATLGQPIAVILPSRPPLPQRDSAPALPAPAAAVLRAQENAATAAPSRMRRLFLRSASALFLCAALGALIQLVSGMLMPAPAPVVQDMPGLSPQPTGTVRLDIASADPAVVIAWSKQVFGEAYPVPPAPAGFELVGGRREWFAGQPLVALVYRRTPDLLTLYVARSAHASGLEALSKASWSQPNWRFGTAGNWQQQDIEAFRAATVAVTGKAATAVR